MRGSLLGGLVVAACALAADARLAEACSQWPSGVIRRDVLPEDGAVDVPTNARVVVTYETVDGTVGELALRTEAGVAVIVEVERVQDDPFHTSLVVRATLEPSTRYELLDRLDLACAYDSAADCLRDPVVIATFTTGQTPDTTPPEIGRIDVIPGFECNQGTTCTTPDLALGLVQIAALYEDRPDAWVRYEYLDEAGDVLAGPTSILSTAYPCGGGSGPLWRQHLVLPETVRIRAVDLAGNVEAASHALYAQSCLVTAELAENTACDPTPGDGRDVLNDGGEEPDGGCCRAGGPTAPGAAVLLLALVGAPRAARGRRPRARRRR